MNISQPLQPLAFDVTGRTLMTMSGADRVRFLNGFCTNDVKALQPGGGCEAFITSTQGKTLGHVWIACRARDFILSTVPDQAATLIPHLEKFVVTEDVVLRDVSKDFVQLLIGGQGAAEVLGRLCGEEPPVASRSHSEPTIDGATLFVQRVDHLGPNSFLIAIPQSSAEKVRSVLQAAGVIFEPDTSLLTAWRIEHGRPEFGADMSEDNLPQEIGIDLQAISFRKGCYLGQETVARLDALGHVNRKLAGVKFAGETIPAAGTELTVDGKSVGRITSAAMSPTLQRPIAFAMLRAAQTKPGTLLESAIGPAEVMALPLQL